MEQETTGRYATTEPAVRWSAMLEGCSFIFNTHVVRQVKALTEDYERVREQLRITAKVRNGQ